MLKVGDKVIIVAKPDGMIYQVHDIMPDRIYANLLTKDYNRIHGFRHKCLKEVPVFLHQVD